MRVLGLRDMEEVADFVIGGGVECLEQYKEPVPTMKNFLSFVSMCHRRILVVH